MKQETVKQTKKVAGAIVAKAEAQMPVAMSDFADGGWDSEVVDTKDILIPKALLMHGTSDLVKKGERSNGEIIKSTSGEVIAKRGEQASFMVFDKWKEWRIMKKSPTGRYEYAGREEWTPENDNLPWEYTTDQGEFRRDKTLNFYALNEADITAGKAFPIRLSFTRTGYRAGLKIADAYARALMEKQPPTRQFFNLSSELVTGKEETYFAFKVEAGKATDADQRAEALKWRVVIMQSRNSNNLKDHEVDEEVTSSNTDTSEF